jgi:hypothetical protein
VARAPGPPWTRRVDNRSSGSVAFATIQRQRRHPSQLRSCAPGEPRGRVRSGAVRVVLVTLPVTPSNHARAAGALFGAQAIFAIVHLSIGAHYPGCTRALGVVNDVALAVIWGAAAVAGFAQRPASAYFAMLCGVATSVLHGVLYSTVLSSHGPYGVAVPFLAAAALGGYSVANALPVFEAAAREADREGAHRAVHWRFPQGLGIRRRTRAPA